MKHLFTLALITVFSSLLFSCEKETVEPSIGSEANVVTDANNSRCKSYSYVTKSGTEQSYGQVWGELIMVAFKQGISPAAKRHILSKYRIVVGISSETTMDFSGMQISMVQLRKGCTCLQADNLRKELELNSDIIFTGPAFQYRRDQWNYQMIAVSNEIMFFIEEGTKSKQLEELERQTGAVVYSSEAGFYVLGTNKYSSKDVLSICSYMNTLPYIVEAYPNDIVSLPIPYEAETSSSTSRQKINSSSWKAKANK